MHWSLVMISLWPSGDPTHDKDGNELEGKARDKAKKEVDKARKVREPLTKKLEQEPDFMAKLEAEIAALAQQLKGLSA